VRLLPPNLILPFCLLLISCSRHHLPPIKDSAALQKDCSILYRQFPVSETPTNDPDFDYEHSLGIRKIREDKCPDSILALHPYMVCSYQGGIQIWIEWPRQLRDGGAYYVASNPELPPPSFDPSNDFIFKNSTFNGIYEVRQKTRGVYTK
jgi:hypothetical protein